MGSLLLGGGGAGIVSVISYGFNLCQHISLSKEENKIIIIFKIEL